MENKSAALGKNRTGVQMSPADTKKMLSKTKAPPPPSGDAKALAKLRAAYFEAAGPVGSVPPPATAKGAVKSGAKALTGKRAHVFIDRLGERLAFERSGTRLYEAMLTKCRAAADDGQAYLPDMERFCTEEAEHFRMLVDCLESLGADPTAQTPGADVAGVESTGLMQVVTDPMTSVPQSLHAILVAELADNAGWDELIALARDMGQDEMASRFDGAQRQEREHLEKVRTWHQEASLAESRLV